MKEDDRMEQKNYKFQDVCEIVTDYVANGSFKSLADNVQYSDKKDYARLIRLVDFNNNYDEKNAVWVPESSYNFLKKSVLYGDEVIISNVGANLGTVFKCPKLTYPMTLGPNSLLVRTNDLCNQNYLYYYLKSKIGYSKLMALVSGSAMPKFNKTELRNMEISLPDIAYQDKAVEVLIKIDKKIELNNKINNNLFELLKTNFKNNFYNKGENDSYLLDYISETIGGDWGKESPEGNNNTKVYCVRGADIPNMEYGNKGNAPIRYILEKNYKNKKLDPNNIIIEISGGSPTQSTGRTAYITQNILDMYDSPLLCTNFCRAIETKDEMLAPFVYMNLKLMYEDNIFFNWENGTTGIKNLALHDMLANTEVKTPDEDVIKEFYLLFNNVMNKISNNSSENIKLEQLRDALLPKLMNGEIDLDNVEI